MYKPWFERDPSLLEDETEAYKEKGLDFHLNEESLIKKRVAIFDGVVKVSDGVHKMQVIYPAGFPDVPPLIRDLTKKLPRHQEPYSGVICIEEKITGADRVLEAIELINIFNSRPNEIVNLEIDAPEPASIYYPYSKVSSDPAYVIIPSTMTNFSDKAWGDFTLNLLTFQPPAIHRIIQSVLYEVHDANTGKTYSIGKDVLTMQSPFTLKGQWIKVKEQPPYLKTFEDFRDWFFKQENKLKYRYERQRTRIKDGELARDFEIFGVVYREEGPKRREYNHDQWLIGLQSEKNHIKALMRPFIMGVDEDYFQRIPSLLKLQDKKVVLVGLGALGSNIAIELARAGVGNFCLIDSDIYDSGNVVRQAMDLRMVGLSKVSAMEFQIKYINPFANVTPWAVKLGMPVHEPEQISDGEGDDLSKFYEIIQQCDLVISTIADQKIEFLINDIVVASGKPAMFASVLNGAWGGQIFRGLSDEACLECYGHHKKDKTTGQVNEDPTTQPIYARGCCFPTFAGAGFDTSIIANLTSRFSVQLLLRDDGGYPNVNYNLINWNSRSDSIGDFPNLEKRKISKHPLCKFHKNR